MGAAALLASLAMTAVYHLGYSDFRSPRLARRLAGDVLSSICDAGHAEPDQRSDHPHLGSPRAPVLVGFDADLFLPPHG